MPSETPEIDCLKEGSLVEVIISKWDSDATYVIDHIAVVREIERNHYLNSDGSVNIDLVLDMIVDIPIGSRGFLVKDASPKVVNAVVCFPLLQATAFVLKESLKVIKPQTSGGTLKRSQG